MHPLIPSRKRPYPYDAALYRERHRIENMFARLKDWRRVATRYDRCAHIGSGVEGRAVTRQRVVDAVGRPKPTAGRRQRRIAMAVTPEASAAECSWRDAVFLFV